MPSTIAAFTLLDPRTRQRIALDPTTGARNVAAWLRHAAGLAADTWPFGPTGYVVHGHGEGDGDRLSYLAIPRGSSITLGAIAGPPALADRVRWLAERIEWTTVSWDGAPRVTLAPTHAALDDLTAPALTWSTVTPVVLPGHVDRRARERHDRKLLDRVLEHSRISPADVEEIERSEVPFRAGPDPASRYQHPVAGHRAHLRVRFRSPRAGVLALGAARYRGLGLLAAE